MALAGLGDPGRASEPADQGSHPGELSPCSLVPVPCPGSLSPCLSLSLSPIYSHVTFFLVLFCSHPSLDPVPCLIPLSRSHIFCLVAFPIFPVAYSVFCCCSCIPSPTPIPIFPFLYSLSHSCIPLPFPCPSPIFLVPVLFPVPILSPIPGPCPLSPDAAAIALAPLILPWSCWLQFPIQFPIPNKSLNVLFPVLPRAGRGTSQNSSSSSSATTRIHAHSCL